MTSLRRSRLRPLTFDLFFATDVINVHGSKKTLFTQFWNFSVVHKIMFNLSSQFLQHASIVVKCARNRFRLSGIYPTVVTPFSEDHEESVDLGKFEIMLRHLERYPVSGFALLGGSGEFKSIGYHKKTELIQYARNFLGKNKIILAGAGLECKPISKLWYFNYLLLLFKFLATYESIGLTERLAKVGADAVLVYNPSFYNKNMDHQAYFDHFSKIADHSPIPIIIYNMGAGGNRQVPVDVISQLAHHNNIYGLLDTTGDVTSIAMLCKDTHQLSLKNNHFDVVTGSAGWLLPGLSVGKCIFANHSTRTKHFLNPTRLLWNNLLSGKSFTLRTHRTY